MRGGFRHAGDVAGSRGATVGVVLEPVGLGIGPWKRAVVVKIISPIGWLMMIGPWRILWRLSEGMDWKRRACGGYRCCRSWATGWGCVWIYAFQRGDQDEK